jgi:hypothetical protein
MKGRSHGSSHQELRPSCASSGCASLTPGTFDQVIALSQLHEFLSYLQVIVIMQLRELRLCLSVLGLEIGMRFGPLVSLLQHINIRSSSKVCDGG